MQTTGGEPNLDKFREVAEAYSILSVKESKTYYDMQRKKNPLAFFKDQKDFEARTAGVDRDKAGI